MKTKAHTLSRSYLAALRLHLKPGPAPGLAPARKLGLRALALGLETLDLARMHEEALITLVLPNHTSRAGDRMVRRAGTFFAEAVTPIEETHRGARESNVQLKGMIETLTRRTEELAASNEELKGEILRRKAVEDSLRTSEETSSQLLARSRQLQEELRLLSRRLLSAQEEERKRISRELHDVVAQTLTGINLRLAALTSKSAASAKDLHRRIAITQRLVTRSVDIVHRFARDLRPAVLDDLGLVPALQTYLTAFIERTGIRVEFTAYAGVEKLDSAVRTALFRVVQEALTNISRHAKASHAKVEIRKDSGCVRMEVHDNGRGFRVEGEAFASSSKRLGLLGMRERVEMVGGTFCVESAPGQETTIRVEIPHAAATPAVRKRAAKRSSKNASLKCP